MVGLECREKLILLFDTQVIKTKAGATRATAVAATEAAATAKVMVAAMARATVVAMVTTTMAVAMAEATTTPGGTMAATRGVTEVDTVGSWGNLPDETVHLLFVAAKLLVFPFCCVVE